MDQDDTQTNRDNKGGAASVNEEASSIGDAEKTEVNEDNNNAKIGMGIPCSDKAEAIPEIPESLDALQDRFSEKVSKASRPTPGVPPVASIPKAQPDEELASAARTNAPQALDALQDRYCAKLSQNKDYDAKPCCTKELRNSGSRAHSSVSASSGGDVVHVQVLLDSPNDCAPGAHPVEGLQLLPGEGATQEDEENNIASTEPCIHAHLDSGSTDEVATDCYEGKIVQERPKNRKLGWVIIATGALIGVLVIILLAVPFRDQSSQTMLGATKEPTQSPTSTPTSPPLPFTDDLPNLVTTSIQNDVHSPFYHANVWLLSDPNFVSYSLARKKQRFYLAMLYFATNGNDWFNNKHWMSYDVSECNWFFSSSYPTDSPYYEPSICDSNGTFINLSLASNNLTGSLPIWYTPFLPYLRVLDFFNNTIGGQLPPATTSEHLEVLCFSNTHFEGKPIINAMGKWENLRTFEWENGKIIGGGNGAFHYMVPNVERYIISDIETDRFLFSSVGLLTNLQYYESSGHAVATATIPTQLGLLTDLIGANFSNSPGLHGTIPSELGLLSKLTWLNLLGTSVTGSIPSKLCYNISRGELDIQANCSILKCCST